MKLVFISIATLHTVIRARSVLLHFYSFNDAIQKKMFWKTNRQSFWNFDSTGSLFAYIFLSSDMLS